MHDLIFFFLCTMFQSCNDSYSPLWKKSLKIGQLFACVFSEDGVWYRAMLVDILKPNKLIVKYIDFGNCEITTIDKLRELPPELEQVPQQVNLYSVFMGDFIAVGAVIKDAVKLMLKLML